MYFLQHIYIGQQGRISQGCIQRTNPEIYNFVTSVDSLDWKDYGVDSIINTVCNHKHLGNGSIILCHNGAKYTAQALDEMITTLQEAGYEFVPLSELIIRENYHMDVEGRQIPD